MENGRSMNILSLGTLGLTQELPSGKPAELAIRRESYSTPQSTAQYPAHY